MAKRLTKTVPIRVTPKRLAVLRQLANARDTDVSKVVRFIIDDYLARNPIASGEASNAERDISGGSNGSRGSLGIDLAHVGSAA